MNGSLDAFKSIGEAFSHITPYVHYVYMFGSKGGVYSFDGILDEIKVFYESFTSTGKRKFAFLISIILSEMMLDLSDNKFV